MITNRPGCTHPRPDFFHLEASMKQIRASSVAGIILILVGLVSIINLYIPGSWAALLIGVGIFFLIVSFLRRNGDLAISGTVNLTLGGILLYQSLSGDWASWYYLWPLIFTAVGAGMLLMSFFRPGEDWTHGTYLRVSLAFTLAGLAAAAGLWLVRDQLNWTVILWGMGALFAVIGLVSGLSPLLIPGAILGGIGALFAYQVASGDWASWSYAWALLPGFVGLGLLLAFIRQRVMRIIGASMVGWSLLFFTIFGLVFAREGQLVKFWPVALVVAGLVIMGQGLITRRSNAN